MFQKETIEAAGIDWGDADSFNGYLAKLKNDQVKQIIVEGDLARSKLAWKITVYSQSIRYRLVELAESCIDEWDKDRFVACFIMARSIIETVSVLCEFEQQLNKAVSQQDIKVIDSLIMNRTFGTRLPDLFDNNKAYEALSVLTAIDKLDKRSEGCVRLAYDRLSEYAHTNYFGVSGSYARIDYTYGDVSCGNQNTKRNVFMRLQVELGLLEVAYMMFEKIKLHIQATADLQD